MKQLIRVLNFTVTPGPIDLWLLRLTCFAVAGGILAVAAIVVPRHALNDAELFLGLGLACMTCLVSVVFGNLAIRVEAVKIAARQRFWEWLSYGVGLSILVLGMWLTTTLSLTRVGFICAFLLSLGTALATFSVGILVTLRRADLSRVDKP